MKVTWLAICAVILLFTASPKARADQNWTCQGVTKALPDGVLPSCGKGFGIYAQCNQTDQVTLNEFTPFEPFETIVTGIKVVYITNDTIVWSQQGNGFFPDLMGMTGYGEKSEQHIFAGGMPWPSKTAYTAGQWLDDHVVCSQPGCPAGSHDLTACPEHLIGWYGIYYRPYAPG